MSTTFPAGTPVIVTVRGKAVRATVAGVLGTARGPFYVMADGRKARPACVKVEPVEQALSETVE